MNAPLAKKKMKSTLEMQIFKNLKFWLPTVHTTSEIESNA